jgi:hypothetical protein
MHHASTARIATSSTTEASVDIQTTPVCVRYNGLEETAQRVSQLKIAVAGQTLLFIKRFFAHKGVDKAISGVVYTLDNCAWHAVAKSDYFLFISLPDTEIFCGQTVGQIFNLTMTRIFE